MRWVDVDDDLRRLVILAWRTRAQDRKEWRGVVLAVMDRSAGDDNVLLGGEHYCDVVLALFFWLSDKL